MNENKKTEKKQTFFQKMAYLADNYSDQNEKLNFGQRLTGGLSDFIERNTLGRMGMLGRIISTGFRTDNYGKGIKKDEKKFGRRKGDTDESSPETSRSPETPGERGGGGTIIGDNIVSAIERSRYATIMELKTLGESFRSGLQSVSSELKSQSGILADINGYEENTYLVLEEIYELISSMVDQSEEAEIERKAPVFPDGKKTGEEKKDPANNLADFISSILGMAGIGVAGAGLGTAATRAAAGMAGAGKAAGAAASGAGAAAKTSAGAKALGSVGKFAGKSIPFVGGAISGGAEYAESGDIVKSILVGGGSVIGGALGALGGTALTPVAPGVATVAGAVGGSYAGGELVGGAYDYLFGPSTPEENSSRPVPEASILSGAEATQPKNLVSGGMAEPAIGGTFSSAPVDNPTLMDFSNLKTLRYTAEEITFDSEKINFSGAFPVSKAIEPKNVEEQKNDSILSQMGKIFGFDFGSEEETTGEKIQTASMPFFGPPSTSGGSSGGYLSYQTSPANNQRGSIQPASQPSTSSYFDRLFGGVFGGSKPSSGGAPSGKSGVTLGATGPLPKNLNAVRGIDTRIKKQLTDKVSALQSTFGKKLTITSGFRDPQRNKAVGGASNSAHTRASAVDIKFDGGVDETNRLISLASKAGFGGIGVYRPGLLHLDIEGRRAWGPNYSYSSVPDWAKETINAHLSGKASSAPTQLAQASEKNKSEMAGLISSPQSGEGTGGMLSPSTSGKTSGASPSSAGSMVSGDVNNMISNLSTETSLSTLVPPTQSGGPNIFNNISNVRDTNQSTESVSSKVPLPAIDKMFERLFDFSGMF